MRAPWELFFTLQVGGCALNAPLAQLTHGLYKQLIFTPTFIADCLSATVKVIINPELPTRSAPIASLLGAMGFSRYASIYPRRALGKAFGSTVEIQCQWKQTSRFIGALRI
jgi:hypothetical protein